MQPKIRGNQIPIGRLCVSNICLIPFSTIFARWGKATYIKTGMITDKQNTKATDNVIFSMTSKLLIPGFYVTQSVKERPTKGKTVIIGKNEAI